MAQKSSNTKGNPYHDEGTGQFTSADGSGSSSDIENGIDKKQRAIRLKPNFDINAARGDLQQAKAKAQSAKAPIQQIQQIGQYKDATNISEANEIGKAIVPGCFVNYSDRCDLEKVNELNKALGDIANRFPAFVQNGLLNAYGDGLSLSRDQMMDIVTKSALSVVQKDPHFKRIYDDFFEISKARFGLSDDDKFDEKVFSHFMRLDSNFNVLDYTQHYGGGSTMAYYQVSQDNIFSREKGGKGINGAIKFYTSILQKATPAEIRQEKYMVDTGFHFDYGGHSYTYATGVHELGHSIFTIAYKKCTDEERDELNRLLMAGRGKDRNQVSIYGSYTDYEQEAESVADVMCRGSQATPHNKKMVEWLDKVHQRLKNAGEV